MTEEEPQRPKGDTDLSRPRSDDSECLVCLGASAGGLEALEEFFGSLPPLPNVPFVVVVHLSPDFKSLLPELLAKHTNMRVIPATKECVIEKNHVYIISPGTNVVVSGKRLLIETQDRTPGRALNLPIDLFFNSVGHSYPGRSIAVVFSGTGSDGSRGIRAIKEAGGIVFCQTPSTSKFNGMPVSAIQTGLVDQNGSPKELAERLVEVLNNTLPPPLAADDLPEEEAEDYKPIVELLSKRSGTNLGYFRTKMLSRRIKRRMAMAGIAELSDYQELLESSEEEQTALQEDLLIGVTRFFRDPEAFNELRTKAFKRLILDGEEGQPLRIWVPACSAGHEVYSIAILMFETMRELGVERELKIFATDLDVKALQRASLGAYSMSEVADVPVPLLSRYFEQRGNSYCVRPELRTCVVFARHNLVTDPPFARSDLVSCRNLLIYLEPTSQERALTTLFLALKPERGVLFLGTPESPAAIESGLICLSVKHKVFRREGSLPRTLPLRPSGVEEPLTVVTAPSRTTPTDSSQRSQLNLLRQVLEASFELEGQSAAIIDEHGRLVDVLTDPLSVFRLPKGRPTVELSRLLSSELVTAVSAGQQQLKNGNDSASYVAPRIGSTKNEDWSVYLHRLSSRPHSTLHSQHALLVLRSHRWKGRDESPQEVDSSLKEREKRLEQELRQTKESLQATIEELQSTNEEQQSTNEELIAANEELQSTNEELQSVNEELSAVNTEYQAKNTELQTLTADLDNLLASTGVATLYLDAHLKVRKFTPLISRVIPLQLSDHGRPITNLASDFDTSFVSDLQKVLETSNPIEREVRDRSGAWVMMRICPYQTLKGTLRGLLITFVDVTRIKNTVETARVMSAQLVALNHKLTAQSEQLEELLALVADDFKRPMNAFDGALKLLSRSLASRNYGAMEKHTNEALLSLDGMKRKIHSLAEMTRSGEQPPQEESVDLRPWFEDLLAPFAEACRAKNVRVHWVCEQGNFKVPTRILAGVLHNLAQNALVHGTSEAEPQIDIICQVEKDRLRLTVIDNGRGIAPTDHQRIFELFRRLEPNRGDGSGVGLVTARRFAERVGGEITVESKLGRGAKFTATLPVSREGEQQPRSEKRPVLLVEDDTVDALRVRRLLSQHDVHWVRSLGDAEREVCLNRYALVLLDLSLPDGHGLKLANSLPQLNGETPIIILSGQTEGLMGETLEGMRVAGTFTKDNLDSDQLTLMVSQMMLH